MRIKTVNDLRVYRLTKKILAFIQILIITSILLAVGMAQSNSNGSENINTAMDTNGVNSCVVVLGASYAKSWNIKELFGCSVVNKGIDGNQSFEMRERFNNDVLSQEPQYVVLWGFINDIFRANPEKLNDVQLKIKQSYREMVSLSHKRGIEPILITEVTIREQSGIKSYIMNIIGGLLGKTSYQEFINSHVININIWMRDFAETENLRLLDAEKLLAEAGGKRRADFAKDDGSHITQDAYTVLTAAANKKFGGSQ